MTTAQPGYAGQELLQPADGQDVEVVGRLVEQEHVGPAHQHLGQQHPQLEPARQRASGARWALAGMPRPSSTALARASSV